jgi:hypothetical protein
MQVSQTCMDWEAIVPPASFSCLVVMFVTVGSGNRPGSGRDGWLSVSLLPPISPLKRPPSLQLRVSDEKVIDTLAEMGG